MAERAALQEPLLPARSDASDGGDVQLQLGDQAGPPTAASTPPPRSRPPPPPGVLGAAGPLSLLAFSWVSPLLQRGSTQELLQQSDLFELPPDLLPSTCGQRLWSRWQAVSRLCGGTLGPHAMHQIVLRRAWRTLLSIT